MLSKQLLVTVKFVTSRSKLHFLRRPSRHRSTSLTPLATVARVPVPGAAAMQLLTRRVPAFFVRPEDMRSFAGTYLLSALLMLMVWPQLETTNAKIVQKVIAGIALPVVAGAGAGLAGGVVAGAMSGAHRDRGYHPASATYYTTYERSYSTRPRPQPSPLLHHLRKAIQYSFEHRRRPQYVSWLATHSPQHYVKSSYSVYPRAHSYQPTYGGSYRKAVYPYEGSSIRTSLTDAQIECKVVSEDVTPHREIPPLVPPHEEEAHYLFKPKGHDKMAKVVLEHHHYHDDEAEDENEEHPERNVTGKAADRYHKVDEKYYHYDEDSDSQQQRHDSNEEIDDDDEDSFARRRAIRRKTKRRNAAKQSKSRLKSTSSEKEVDRIIAGHR
ncbi:hypothetical protein BIW11_07531 [Tropilaelaps mercedesae]|uniref:Uncharacterized protein n=1 Tax=Tropilaelaps mercedesae TaxID=418985 RepID=A0A1V9XTL7_9ACAR|nr:hypothetical protein BIW11_07531 [Tropilaelaps mercedesae]